MADTMADTGGGLLTIRTNKVIRATNNGLTNNGRRTNKQTNKTYPVAVRVP